MLEEHDIDDKFDLAAKFVNSLPANGPVTISDKQKLVFYALYKQSTVGDCNSPKPSMFSLVERAKWSAWDRVRGYSKAQAKLEYVKRIEEMARDLDTSALELAEVQRQNEFLRELAKIDERVAARAASPDVDPVEELAVEPARDDSLMVNTGAFDGSRTPQRTPVRGSGLSDHAHTNGSTPQDDDSEGYSLHLGNGGSEYVEDDDEGDFDDDEDLLVDPDDPAAVAALQRTQRRNHKKLCVLEDRMSQLVRATLERTEQKSQQVKPLREELRRLVQTLEQRIHRKEQAYKQAEAQWGGQLEQVSKMQEQLLSKLQNVKGGSRGSALQSAASFVLIAGAVGAAAYGAYSFAKKKKLI